VKTTTSRQVCGTFKAWLSGCLCDECYKASVRIHAKRSERNQTGTPKGQLTHGRAAFVRGACKCDQCREANNQYQRTRRTKAAAQEPSEALS
jgi:hypothetical protein